MYTYVYTLDGNMNETTIATDVGKATQMGQTGGIGLQSTVWSTLRNSEKNIVPMNAYGIVWGD